MRLVGWLLSLTPGEFRGRYRDEYLATTRDRLREASGHGVARRSWAGVREVASVARVVVQLWLDRRARGQVYGGSDSGGGGMMLETLRQDIADAGRTLRRNPGFTLAAVAVSALGIGATAAIFSAVNAFFFRPLPFTEPDRLVLMYETNPEFGWTDATAAPANALDWRDQVEAFDDVALYRDLGVADITLQRDGRPVNVGATTVSGNFFDVLGVRPRLGRGFTWNETWAPNDRVVVLSHRLWVEHFGSDPDVVGSTFPVETAGEPYRIVGVMPEGFAFPTDETRLWLSYGWSPEARGEVWFRRAHFVRTVARLSDGVSLEEADAQLQAVMGRLATQYPETNRVMGAGLMPMRDFLIRGQRIPLLILLVSVAILLAIACVNVANLMLVRASDRQREVALRTALGAGRARVARLFMVESLLVGLGGGLMGLGIGWLGVTLMSGLTRLGIDGATSIALDARVVSFTFGVAVLSGVLFGTAPALRSMRADVSEALHDGGRGHSTGRRGLRSAGLLVATEVALAVLLVVGAALMVRSAYHLRSVDPGFTVDGALAVELSIPSARYPNRDQVLAFWDEIEERLEARPGIEQAGMVGFPPLAGASWSSQFQAEGWPPERVGLEILHRRADRGYFEALDIPLVRGRLFEPSDGPGTQLVVVVNETFAEEHFPGEDPIGQRIAYDRAATPESTWYEIVGIVGDQHQESPRLEARAEVFENRDQDWGRDGWLVLKTGSDPLAVVPAVREVMAEMDPLIPISSVRTLRDVWRASMSQESFILALLGVFGVTALLLATVGVYGVTAQAARRRTQEIGIRLALGASGSSVLGLMLRQGARLIGGGLVVGVLAAVGLTRALAMPAADLLYGVRPTDPGTIGAVVALLGVVGLVACYVPARRATSVDPVRSLTAE